MNLSKDRARKAAVLLLGAAAYALLYALGSQVEQHGGVLPGATLARFAAAWPLALAVLAALMRFALPRLACRADAGACRPFPAALAFMLIFACYVPLFLIEYPGSFMYDTQAQTYQIARGQYSMFHPLLHTLLLRACLSLYDLFGSFEKCAAVYSLLSMTVVSACFALVCGSVSRSVSRRAGWICTAFFCLYPAHMAFASNYTKDGMFAACFALFAALCAEEVRTGGLTRGRRALQAAAGVLACLLRNNMVYAAAAWALLLLLRKKRYLRMALWALAVVALSRAANAGLGAYTHADRGNVAEMLSVPIQQLARARVYAGETFTEEERALMDEVCAYEPYGFTQVWNRYEPTLSDPVKNYLDTRVLTQKMPGLAAMWLRIGRERPDIYLDAFLSLALPSYYPYGEYRVAQPYIEIGIQPGVLTAPFAQRPMTQPGRFEAARTWLYENIYRTGMDDHPVLRWLFNTGLVYWLLLLFELYELYCGRWASLAWMLLPALLWGTYLLGPVMQGRYLYPFICVLPLFALRRCDTGADGEVA